MLKATENKIGVRQRKLPPSLPPGSLTEFPPPALPLLLIWGLPFTLSPGLGASEAGSRLPVCKGSLDALCKQVCVVWLFLKSEYNLRPH